MLFLQATKEAEEWMKKKWTYLKSVFGTAAQFVCAVVTLLHTVAHHGAVDALAWPEKEKQKHSITTTTSSSIQKDRLMTQIKRLADHTWVGKVIYRCPPLTSLFTTYISKSLQGIFPRPDILWNLMSHQPWLFYQIIPKIEMLIFSKPGWK